MAAALSPLYMGSSVSEDSKAQNILETNQSECVTCNGSHYQKIGRFRVEIVKD